MALQLYASPRFLGEPYRLLPQAPVICISANLKFRIKSQKPTAAEAEISPDPAQPEKPAAAAAAAAGKGFGSSSSSQSTNPNASGKSKPKGRRERAAVIRRSPVQKPEFLSPDDVSKAEVQSKNESAFLLAWLGLGGIILLQGIALAASGFLPEEWDKFLVKYLYPSFTPTVGLFVAGTVAYGVVKYLQNENLKGQK